MRVVNDRRRLPRVEWNGNAVIQTRRGELHGVGLDLSADGMAVLAPSPGKAKERVRIHTQLGDFPLLTDARVVRMTKRRDGYRWALRFERMDQRMRANLEAFVRQQLASAARIRQAQLYAERLKGGGLPPPPHATPAPSELRLPTPGPMPAADAIPGGGPSTPLVSIPEPAVPGAQPLELALDGDAPASEPEGAIPLEIELPAMGPSDAPALDRGAVTPPAADDVYVPYQATDAEDEAALLGEGPLSSSEQQAPPPAPEPSQATIVPEAVVAKTITPGIIEIDDNEDLSLEDILSEVDGGEEAAPPPTDLGLPPPRELPADASGLGDVPMLDDDMGDDEETRRRDSAMPGSEEEIALQAARDAVEPSPEPETAPALLGSPVDVTEDAPALLGSPVDVTEDAPALLGSPVDVSGEAPALLGSPVDVTEDAPALLGSPVDVTETAPALLGSPVDVTEDAPALLGSPVDVSDEAPALLGSPVDVSDEAPALPGSPVDVSDEAPALVGSPVDVTEDAPALLGSPVDVPEHAPALLGSPLDVSEDAPALVGSPVDLSAGAPQKLPDADVDATVALEGVSVPTAPPASTTSTLVATEAPPKSATNTLTAGLPFDEEPADAGALGTVGEPVPAAPAEPVAPTFEAHPSPFYDPEPEEAEPEIPEPFAEVPASSVPTPVGDPEPPRLPNATPPPSSATPAPNLYSDDAEPFDPYAPNPEPTEGAAPPQLGSAPRALGELPPAVEGLYTPTSNPRIDEPSGAYATASFEPFPSAEQGLYGDREDVSFEEQQGNPRQRLAVLQQDDRSTHKLAEQHNLFLGDIEGVTSGLTPTPIKMGMTDEDLESEMPPADPDAATSIAGAPDLVEAEPTRPVDVGPAEFTPPPHDVTPPPHEPEFTPEPQELSLDDVEFEEVDAGSGPNASPDPVARQRGLPTYPEFNVIPDFEQPLPPSEPSGPEPAQSGRTVVTSLESLGMMRPPDESPVVAPQSAPGDFAVLPSFGGGGGQPAAAGFTVVAALDDGDDGAGAMGGGTMIASPEDVEAWKAAAFASPEVEQPGQYEDERTVTYTPAPGTLPPAQRPLESQQPSFGGGAAMNEDALTAMRVGRGAMPSGGAGFELNPRGPAPAQPQPSPAPAAPVGRVPIAKVPAHAAGRPSRKTASPVEAPSSRPTLMPEETRAATGKQAAPGRSSRGRTSLESGGRPAPPPKPAPPAPAEPKKEGVVPPLRGSGSVAPAAPASRRSLVEDALAQLKRKTEEKRKGRDTEGVESKPQVTVKQAARQRRRRRLGQAEQADPAIADLYKAAMTDLERSRE